MQEDGGGAIEGERGPTQIKKEEKWKMKNFWIQWLIIKCRRGWKLIKSIIKKKKISFPSKSEKLLKCHVTSFDTT